MPSITIPHATAAKTLSPVIGRVFEAPDAFAPLAVVPLLPVLLCVPAVEPELVVLPLEFDEDEPEADEPVWLPLEPELDEEELRLEVGTP